uniref:phospholipase A2 n=1 Tax=Daphnia galeata TaxID=27404 RepID=A0A8J2RM05_9CRUS|nr:unnamed protein product [Daphnia galeata]
MCLVLYDNAGIKFELILTNDANQVFSLCRSNFYDIVKLHFNWATNIFPMLVEVCEELKDLQFLQEVWLVITNNPNWNTGHIVAYFGLRNGLLSVPDAFTGMTPINVAAKKGKAEFFKAMLDSGMFEKTIYEKKDFRVNLAFHYSAISANKETIETLALCGLDGAIINAKNEKQSNAVHLACRTKRPECIKAPNSRRSKCKTYATTEGVENYLLPSMYEMKNGGTPLHWVKIQSVLKHLIERGYSIDARNFTGQTALHVVVKKTLFDCSLSLLSCGANPNLVDSSGDSPLHIACSSANFLITQTLIAFGSDVNTLNNQGESPRHLVARNTSNTDLVLLYCFTQSGQNVVPRTCQHVEKDAFQVDDVLNQVCQDPPAANKKLKSTIGGRILCMDGGGIRGLVLIQMLEILESILGGPVIQYFDCISGTSTGGIVSLALCTGNSDQECKQLFFRLKDRVFCGSKPYDSEILESFLKTEFGDRTMADIIGPKVIVTAVKGDTIPADLHIFHNYISAEDLLSFTEETKGKNAAEQMVWQAARASSAAPVYFRPHDSFLDGALIANNPTLDTLTEITEYNTALNQVGVGGCIPPTLVVSLGTGRKPIKQVTLTG